MTNTAQEPLNDFQKLQAEKMAEFVVNKMKEEMVCIHHCKEHRTKIYYVFGGISCLLIFGVFGYNSIPLLKLIIKSIII